MGWMEWRWERGEGAGKDGEEHSGECHEGEKGREGWKGGETWKGGGIGMEGETGKEGETGMEGEEGMSCFPLMKALAFSLLGSIRPSHILQNCEERH